jgi:hypothetical protein
MNKQDFQKLMDTTFKGSFLSNTLTKLYTKEISPEDFKQLISQKRNEISSKNPSLSEDQKYQVLMMADDDKKETESQPTSSTKLLENKDKPEKSDLKQSAIKFNLPLLYIIILVSTLALSILMTAPTIKLGKPALISTDLESTDGNFKILEDAKEKNPELEFTTEAQDVKFNLKKNSLLILPKMKKIIFPTFEGVFGFVIKYGLNIVNLSITLFGRFFNKNNIKWLKTRLCIIFTLLPMIRIYILYRINNEFKYDYQSQKLEFYKSKELFQYNPKNLPYNLYSEIAHSLFSMFLALNQVSAYVVDAFYKSNSIICEFIKNIFEIKTKKLN